MGTVIIAENLGMFEKFVGGEALLKFCPVDEMIGKSVGFGDPRLSRRI
jgi:hypothetical protein